MKVTTAPAAKPNVTITFTDEEAVMLKTIMMGVSWDLGNKYNEFSETLHDSLAAAGVEGGSSADYSFDDSYLVITDPKS